MPASLFEVLKPYLWLTLAAFLAGFVSYVAVEGPRTAQATERVSAPRVSAPASEDWNLPKRI